MKEVKIFLEREKENRKHEVEKHEIQTGSKIKELKAEIERLQTEKEMYKQERAPSHAKVQVFTEATHVLEEGAKTLESMIEDMVEAFEVMLFAEGKKWTIY